MIETTIKKLFFMLKLAKCEGYHIWPSNFLSCTLLAPVPLQSFALLQSFIWGGNKWTAVSFDPCSCTQIQPRIWTQHFTKTAFFRRNYDWFFDNGLVPSCSCSGVLGLVNQWVIYGFLLGSIYEATLQFSDFSANCGRFSQRQEWPEYET